MSVTSDTLENDLVRVVLAPDGTLASVYDKRAAREALDGPGNQLWAYVDKPREYDAWEVDASYPTQGEQHHGHDGGRRGRPAPGGDPRHAPLPRLAIVQDVRLWAGSPRIDFHTRLDWHDRRFLLKARFPLAVRSSRATFETAFGVVERATHRNTSWEQARFEVAGHRFADLSEPGYGVALLNDGRYGHHAEGSELGLSLLRSPLWPDPLADEGEQEVVYSLLPHTGTWLEGGVLAEAEDLNRPLLARAVCRGDGGIAAAAGRRGPPGGARIAQGPRGRRRARAAGVGAAGRARRRRSRAARRVAGGRRAGPAGAPGGGPPKGRCGRSRSAPTPCAADPGPLLGSMAVLDQGDLERALESACRPPLRIVAIYLAAFLVNRIARRAVKRSLTKLHTGAVRERMGAMRRRTPAALLETGETSLRAEQRIDALSSVLRSVLTFTIFLIATLTACGELGIDLAPLLAGAGVLGVAIGFGSPGARARLPVGRRSS